MTFTLTDTELENLNIARKLELMPGRGTSDLFGEFADVQPITIRNAGLLLRESAKRMEAARLAHKSASEAVQETNRAYGEAIETHRKAEHRLKISAMQPNGGEA